MEIPVRILRAHVETIIDRRATWRPHQWAREAAILRIGLTLLLSHGRHIITRKALAAAIGIAPATLRRYFCDIDALMGEILRRHLQTLADALAAIPATTPNLMAARRQAWLAATRTKTGAFTDAHTLFLRDRHLLPPDILPGLEQTYQNLGTQLAGPHAAEALALLDLAPTTATNIENLLAVFTQPATTARALPTPSPHLPTPAFTLRHTQPAPKSASKSALKSALWATAHSPPAQAAACLRTG